LKITLKLNNPPMMLSLKNFKTNVMKKSPSSKVKLRMLRIDQRNLRPN